MVWNHKCSYVKVQPGLFLGWVFCFYTSVGKLGKSPDLGSGVLRVQLPPEVHAL
jgi:hypothetical protein